MKLNLDENKLIGFNDRAKRHLEDSINEFAEQVVKEAYRQEKSSSSLRGEPEITSTMVENSVRLISQNPNRQRGWWIVLKILSGMFALFAGLFSTSVFDLECFSKSPLAFAIFLILFAVSITLSSILEGKNA